MTTVTINLSDEERALIDEVRGNYDLAAFLHSAGIQVARREAARRHPAPLADELTPADHIRLAAAAETNAVDFEEFERLVWQDIEQQRAARAAGGKQ